MKNFINFNVKKLPLSRYNSPKNRRAISTVVSSAILISAVAIMGTMLVAWSNTNLFTKQVAMEASFNEKMNKLNENLLIEYVWFGTGPSVVNVTLSNIGEIGLNVTSIQLENSTDTLIFSITDGGIAPDDEYSLEETYYWNSGETVDFSVFTERDNIFTSQEVT